MIQEICQTLRISRAMLYRYVCAARADAAESDLRYNESFNQ